MRTVTAKSVLEGVLRREGGANLTTASAAEVSQFFEYIADRLRTAWEYHPWLETFEIEERLFRPEWDAGTTYAAAAEVYFDAGAEISGYFSANASPATPAAAESPATNPEKWTELSTLRRLVAFEQPGETEFEGCVQAWDRDPDASVGAGSVDFVLAGDGVVLPPSYTEDSVWLKLVKKCENFGAVLYSADATYAAGEDVVYLAPHCYAILEDTTAGDTPESAPSKFRQLEFPLILARAVKAGAVADWQLSDGASEKAAAMEATFYRLLDEQKWKLVATHGQRGRIRFSSGLAGNRSSR